MQRETISRAQEAEPSMLKVNYEMQDGRRSASGLKSLLEIEPQD